MAKKSLCQWDSKKIIEKKEKYVEKVSEPKFLCVRCGRVAKLKQNLCKPENLFE